jgi:hypothetical protein
VSSDPPSSPLPIVERARLELARLAQRASGAVPSGFDPTQLDLREATYHRTSGEVLAMLDKVEAALDAGTDETLSARSWAFWRTTRFDLGLRGYILPGELLESAQARSGCTLFASRRAYARRPRAGAVGAAVEMLDGLPCHPSSTDDPTEKAQIVAGHLLHAHALNIQQGTEKNPHLGAQALKHMRRGNGSQLEPIVAAFPTIDDLIQFENFVVEKALRGSISRSRTTAAGWLGRALALTEPEVQDVMRMTSSLACGKTTMTLDERRAVMFLRLEDALSRAKKQLNFDAEMKVLKLMGDLSGIKAVALNQEANDFARLAAEPTPNSAPSSNPTRHITVDRP